MCRQTSRCSTQLTFPQAAVQTNQLLLQTSHIPTSCCADIPVAAPDISHSHKLLCRHTSCCSRHLTFPQVAVQTYQLLLQTSHIPTSCCADIPVAAPDISHSHKLLCRHTSCCSRHLTFPQVAVQTYQLLLQTSHIPTSCCADIPVAAPDISHSHKLLCRHTSCCSRHLTFPQVAVQTYQLLLQTSHIPTSCCADIPVAAPDISHSHQGWPATPYRPQDRRRTAAAHK